MAPKLIIYMTENLTYVVSVIGMDILLILSSVITFVLFINWVLFFIVYYCWCWYCCFTKWNLDVFIDVSVEQIPHFIVMVFRLNLWYHV